MSALAIMVFLSWFAGLQMGATWYSGVIGWLWRKARRRVVRRARIQDLP